MSRCKIVRLRTKEMRKHTVSACLLLTICSACSFFVRSDQPAPPRAETPSTSASGATSGDPLTSKFFEGNPKGAAAWREFVKDGRYRLAGEQDFRFSDRAKKNLNDIFGEEWKSRAFKPYTAGEINHDKHYHDVAFIVIDKARTDSSRFGIVIFNEQPDDAGHKASWLYRERDLSSTVFGWASDGLRLYEFNSDGKATICRVTWNDLRQEYRCGDSAAR